MKKLQNLSLLILLTLIILYANGIETQASLKFANLGQIHKKTSSVEKGGYIFTLNYNKTEQNYNLNVYRKRASQPFIYLSNIASNILTNGRTLYYSYYNSKNNTVSVIYMNVSTKKTKVYATFENAQNLVFNGISGNKVYFSIINMPIGKENPQSTLYSLNPFNGKINSVLSHAQTNKLGSKRIFYGPSQEPNNAYTLYSSDYSGKNKIKISNNVVYHESINGKVYYVNFENPLSGCYLYSANENGDNKQKLSKKFKCQNVLSITAKDIIYITHSYSGDNISYHKMDILSGNTKEIPNPAL